MEVLQTSTFKKQIKKLHKNQKLLLDQAVYKVIKDPLIGEMKKGDLAGVQVYKFKMLTKLILLAYTYKEEKVQLILLAFGSHENFYRDLKK